MALVKRCGSTTFLLSGETTVRQGFLMKFSKVWGAYWRSCARTRAKEKKGNYSGEGLVQLGDSPHKKKTPGMKG